MLSVTATPEQHDLFVAIVSQLPQNFITIAETKPKVRLFYMTSKDVKHCEEADRITKLCHLWHALWNYAYIYNSDSNKKRVVKQEERPSRSTMISVKLPADCARLNAALDKGFKVVKISPDYTPGNGKPRVGKGNNKLVFQSDELHSIEVDGAIVGFTREIAVEGQEGLIEKQYNEDLVAADVIKNIATTVILGNRLEVETAMATVNQEILRGVDDLTAEAPRAHHEQVELDRLNSLGCEHCKLSPAKCTCGNPIDNERPVEFLDAEYTGLTSHEMRYADLIERMQSLRAQAARARIAEMEASDAVKFERNQRKTLKNLNKKWSIYRLLASKQVPDSNEELEYLGECKRIERREYGIMLSLEDITASCADNVIKAQARRLRAWERMEETNEEIAALEAQDSHVQAFTSLDLVQTKKAKDERAALYLAATGTYTPTTESILRHWLSVLGDRLDACGREDIASFRKLETQYARIAIHIEHLATGSDTQRSLSELAAELIVVRASQDREALKNAVAAYKRAATA